MNPSSDIDWSGGKQDPMHFQIETKVKGKDTIITGTAPGTVVGNIIPGEDTGDAPISCG